MRLAPILAGGLLAMAQPMAASQQYSEVSSPICGAIVVRANGVVSPAVRKRVDVYRAGKKDAPCCQYATSVGTVQTTDSGSFRLDKLNLESGAYFLVLSDVQPVLSVGFWVTGKQRNFDCEHDQRFILDAETGKSEVDLAVSVN